MNDVVNVQDREVVTPGFGSLEGFEFMQRGAKMLAASSLVPKEFQNNISNCVIALNMANRINADPLMVMQNLYVVYGRPSWSSQFLISTFNTCGRFSALRYEWIGTLGSDGYGCRAWAIEKASGEKLEGSVIDIKMAKDEGWYGKSGSKWKTMPQQMLMYRAASFFIRTYAPELAMGLKTSEEVIDMELDNSGMYQMADAVVEQNANKAFVDIVPDDRDVQGVPVVEPETVSANRAF